VQRGIGAFRGQQLETVHIRHGQIEQNHVRALRA